MANKRIDDCRGCVWIPYMEKWRVTVVVKKKGHILGYYDTEEDGRMAWLAEREKLWNENRVVDLHGEAWREIKKYGADYWVSNKGRIKSTNYRGSYMEKLRKPVINKFGYCTVIIRHKKYFVHKLVAEAFIGESMLFVNHKDGNKQNNFVENLEYVTNRSNVCHFFFSKGKTPGVFYNKREKLYVCRIKVENNLIMLGRFHSADEAHDRYMNALLEHGLYGDYNYLTELVKRAV